MTGTLFLATSGHWTVSVPTAIGFQHTKIGNTNTLPTRAAAEARWVELEARKEAS